MQRLTEKERRDIVVQYKCNHPSLSNYAIYKFFLELGISKSTTFSILASYAVHGTTERQIGSGRPAVKIPPNKVHAIVSAVKCSTPLSQNVLARKHGVSQPYVCQILRSQGLKSYKKKKAPSVTDKQRQVQKIRLDRLYRQILSKNCDPMFIMDDEAYFTFSGSNMPQNDHYYSTACGLAENAVKFRQQAKFEDKLMCWIAVSPRGIAKPYFCPSREAVNAQIYQTKCIQQRLIPFINLNHQDGNYIFWPDLASCHYARSTLNLLQHHNICVVPKEMNPPNCPQLRPIEDFWGMLKQVVYAKGWRAENHEQLKRRIKYSLGKIDVHIVQNMMSALKSKIRKARASGVEDLVH
jgi:hypothetical protein